MGTKGTEEVTLPKLYACMMMKQEAHNLDRCLSSIRELCDEIVIVDTGSTDKSIEIARKYGAIVYPGVFNWRKPPIFDFSLHRNSGLQYCEELRADWTLVIDADESLQPIGISPEEFKQRLTLIRPDVHGLGTQVHERKHGKFVLSWWGTRFFRMGVGVHYEGIVHNRPKLVNAYAAGTNVVIYHYGYSDPVVMEAKRHRTLSLLNKRIAEKPDDYEAYYYKALSLFGLERVDEGIECGIKCLEIISPKIDYDYNRLNYIGIMYYAIGWAYYRKWEMTGNQEFATLAYQWWITGWEKWPNDLDLNFWLCQIGYMAKDKDMMKRHGEIYLKAMENYKKELDLPMEKFVNSYDMNDLTIGPRHIHMATEKAENAIKNIMREAA